MKLSFDDGLDALFDIATINGHDPCWDNMMTAFSYRRLHCHSCEHTLVSMDKGGIDIIDVSLIIQCGRYSSKSKYPTAEMKSFVKTMKDTYEGGWF